MSTRPPKSQLPAPRKVTLLKREDDPPPEPQDLRVTFIERRENRDWHRIVYATLFGLAAVIYALGQVV